MIKIIKIALLPNPKKDINFIQTNNIAKYLLEKGAQLFTTEQFDDKILLSHIALQNDELFNTVDIALTLGGDGTILKIAKIAVAHNVPILCINMGTLGYMSEIEASELNELDKLFDGSYEIENRMMLDIELYADDIIVNSYLALNDMVITKGAVSRIVDYNVCVDNTKFDNYRADGVIVATPTGSTAYSLSAGGPIIQPSHNSLLITPICPNSLTLKPMILNDNSEIKVSVIDFGNRDVFLSVDGKENIQLYKNNYVIAKKSEKVLKIIKLKKISFYEKLRTKLH